MEVGQLCRFHIPDQGARVGQVAGESVYDLTASGLAPFATIASLLQASTEQPIGALLQDIDQSSLPAYTYAALDVTPDDSIPHLLPPVDRQEVWAAGVTYERSRDARMEFLRRTVASWQATLGLRTALDVGCGVGYFSAMLRDLGLSDADLLALRRLPDADYHAACSLVYVICDVDEAVVDFIAIGVALS